MTFAVVTNKVRRWCFTLNNYNDDDITKLRSAFSDAEQTRYAVFGYEIAPHTNTPHLQGFVYFKKEQVFTTWLKYRAGLQAHYLQVHNNSNADAPGTRGIWIYGPPRIGKSYQAQRLS